jgi:hypothetical protein
VSPKQYHSHDATHVRRRWALIKPQMLSERLVAGSSPVGGWLYQIGRLHHGGGLMATELRLYLSEDGAAAERVGALTGFLRAELLELDVRDVTALRVGDAPDGARAVDVAAIGELLVSMSSAPEILRSVVSLVQQWLLRWQGGGRSVRMEICGDVLELSNATVEDQAQLVELFLSRHAAAEGRRWTPSERP